MKPLALLLPLLAIAATCPAAELELHKVFVIPSGGWIRADLHSAIPVYLCDPNALDQVTDNGYVVLPGGMGVFLSSGRTDFSYWLAARALAQQFPERHDLAALCGQGAPDAFIRNLQEEPTP